MKLRIITLFLIAGASVVSSWGTQYEPLLVNSDGQLQNSSFFDENKIEMLASLNNLKRDFRIFVDTQPSPNDVQSYKTLTSYQTTIKSTGNTNYTKQHNTYDKVWDLKFWTDCEVKVIDKWGNIVYFTSTICLNNAEVKQLHPEITDTTASVYYWSSEGSDNWCYGEKKQLTNLNSSIGNEISSYATVAGIWIVPSFSNVETRSIINYTGRWVGTRKNVVWGEYIRSVFENPENTVIVWRQTPTSAEYYNGNKLWRPARVEHFGKYYQ